MSENLPGMKSWMRSWLSATCRLASYELEGSAAGPALRGTVWQFGPALRTAVVEDGTAFTGLVVRTYCPVAHRTGAWPEPMERLAAAVA